jgi:transposase-like protein
MGISMDGERDVLGLWAGPPGGEGAKQWMSMLTELRNRGVADVCIVCCDGLKGLPDAIAATVSCRFVMASPGHAGVTAAAHVLANA